MGRLAPLLVLTLCSFSLPAAEAPTSNILVIPKCRKPPVIDGVIGAEAVHRPTPTYNYFDDLVVGRE